MLRVVLGETLNMLHPEEVVPEIRLTLCDGQRPRQAQQHRHHNSHRAVDQQVFNSPLLNDNRDHRDHRHRQCQEALGHKAHAAGQPQQHVAAQLAFGRGRFQRQIITDHRGGQPQGDHRVQHAVGTDTEYQNHRQENQRRQAGTARIAPHQHCQCEYQQRRHAGTEYRTEAHRKVGIAKQPLADVIEPVAGHRFFKITQAKQMWHYPVAALQHFTADLGVTSFIRLPQQATIEGDQVNQSKKNGQHNGPGSF
ncbi:hypothetical protein D3C78_1011900 [compost metagenome]